MERSEAFDSVGITVQSAAVRQGLADSKPDNNTEALKKRWFDMWRKPGQTKYNRTMAKVCQVTGKKPMSGNRVSHANNKTKRRFEPNLHDQRFWVPSEKRWIKLRVSAKAMKTIDKNGIDRVLREMRGRGEKV